MPCNILPMRLFAGGLHENPICILHLALEILVLEAEIALLQWFLLRQAMHSQYLPTCPLYQSPLDAAADRIRINLAQVALYRGMARVPKQFLKTFQLAVSRSRRRRIIRIDGAAKLVTDKQ